MKKLRALLRLQLMLVRMLVLGLDLIFFDDQEIINYTLEYDNFPKDKEKIAYIERLKRNE